MLRNDTFDITGIITRLDALFLLTRGDFCVYVEDVLGEYLSLPSAMVDVVRMQSLFQVCLLSTFSDGKPTTKRFFDAISVNKRLPTSPREKGWDVMEVGVSLDYPLNIIISNAVLQKYRQTFKMLLLLNVGFSRGNEE